LVTSYNITPAMMNLPSFSIAPSDVTYISSANRQIHTSRINGSGEYILPSERINSYAGSRYVLESMPAYGRTRLRGVIAGGEGLLPHFSSYLRLNFS
jgi:hypothetical protein